MLVPGSIPNMVLCLINYVESCVRTENFRYDNAVLCLVVLEEGGHYARQSQ